MDYLPDYSGIDSLEKHLEEYMARETNTITITAKCGCLGSLISIIDRNTAFYSFLLSRKEVSKEEIGNYNINIKRNELVRDNIITSAENEGGGHIRLNMKDVKALLYIVIENDVFESFDSEEETSDD